MVSVFIYFRTTVWCHSFSVLNVSLDLAFGSKYVKHKNVCFQLPSTYCIGDLVKGTLWTAVAMRLIDIGTVVNDTVVHAQVNERTGLDIFIDGVKQDFDDLPTQDWSGTKQQGVLT